MFKIYNITPSIFKVLIYLCFQIIITGISSGQNTAAEDSLLNLIKNETNDSIIVDHYIELSDLTTYNQPKKSLHYSELGISHAQKANYLLGLARSYERMGIVYFHTGDKEASKLAFIQANEVNKQVNDYEIFGSVYYNLSNIHYELGNYDSALVYIEKAKAHFLSHNDSTGYAAAQYLSIGVLTDKGNYYLALKNGLEAREIFRQKNNRTWEIYTLNLLSNVYVILERYSESIAMLYECIKYYKQTNNKKFEGVAERYMADVFLEMEKYDSAQVHIQNSLTLVSKEDFVPEQAKSFYSKGNIQLGIKKYEDALISYSKGLDLADSINDGGLQAQIQVGLGQCYYRLKQYDNSIKSLQKVLDFSIPAGEWVTGRDAYKFLSLAYEQKHAPEKALEYYKSFVTYNDSISKEEKNKQFAELSSKYEAEQKEKEIELLKRENDISESNRKKTVIIFILVLFGAVSILIFFWILNQKNKQLLQSQKEVVKAKNRFFANISHEFRTPLTLMLGPLYQILGNKGSNIFREQLILVQNNAKKLLKLVNQILDLSKLEAGKYELNPIRGEFVSFIKKTVGSFESLAESKNVNLIFETELETLLIWFDADIIENIINNLLSNAIKHEPNGGEVIFSLIVEKQINQDNLIFAIHNKGSVIPKNELDKIFERFHQSKKNSIVHHDFKGTGIGLSFTKELVDLLKGQIEVASNQEYGTKFTVEIPFEESDSDDLISEQTIQSEKIENDLPEVSTLKQTEPSTEFEHSVLVVDDNPDVLNFIISCLTNQYKIHSASNGEEGIGVAINHVPDLIISDVMMPIKDGLELTNSLKNNEATSHIPIILLTAKTSEESRLEGLKTLVDDYLAKPFNPEELLVRVANLIETRKRLREHYSRYVKYSSDAKDIRSLEDVFLDKISKIIEENISNEDFSIEELSLNLGLSRSQLHRKLTALTNMSASQFVRNFRLNRAKLLLEGHAGSISEIAYMVGFNSPIYFNKCFKEYFGITPSEMKIQKVHVVK